MIIDPCLNAFKNALREINPSTSVQKALSIRDGNKLTVANRTYELDKNVHLVAVGKAAPSMTEGAEKVLGGHLVDGIASVPTGINISSNAKTKFFFGAEHNLPDAKALENTKRIEEFILKAKAPDQLILFLISGGGSALLPAPIHGISLEEKVELIQLMQSNGADIKQLNLVRTMLSRLKGGGLARLGHPSKMVSLIMSDIVGDPLELISSGPTVIPENSCDPCVVLNQLDILDRVPTRIVDILESAYSNKIKETGSPSDTDVNNVIVASNSILLDALSAQIDTSSLSYKPLIATNQLEGDATELGAKFAELIRQSLEHGQLTKEVLIDGLLSGKSGSDLSRLDTLDPKSAVILLFGGESTVRFDGTKTSTGAKGGRNQELVLSAFHQLSRLEDKASLLKKGHFALFSLGSDGQDGPTDAAGAFLTDFDISADGCSVDASKLATFLNSKCSYLFWSEYKEGQNLVKTGKTGVNVMDVQMLAMDFSK